MRPIILAAVMLLALAPVAHAQETMEGMDHGDMPGMSAGAPEADGGAFGDVMQEMHEAMMVPSSGNVDVDFVRGMIPHHQGAIDMARIELDQGTDPQIRAIAEAVIEAQEKEIAEMEAWLAEHAPDQPAH